MEENYAEHWLRLSVDLFNITNNILKILYPNLWDHCQRVAQVARTMAQIINWPEAAAHRVFLAGLFHDIGYMAGPAEITTGRPISEIKEHELFERHPILGADIVSVADTMKGVLPIIRHHHEHWDGSGFPDGLKGQDIPVEARLLSVVDFFERITVPRPGMRGMNLEEARAVLEEDAGIIFDPNMVKVFLEKILPLGLFPSD